ncbi:hypothetical protein [Bacillus cytotoxicus]|uniref:hypothetical protein n=1 Tax=Bacillus cytotoxicus TaxID=580165 RepID=UPI0002F59B35|nr:hypothetical protein [Bacillus cytotoxicus]AWC28738.1 hypothetical protein CG483_010435 [Bacillus cytotoxicus]AWC39879.1 hypothetical protein CG480_004820 [Bacillus cytotoxicus]AWC44812.1 hypothetical protein CG479_009975 [Bacillus cytotoxicus]AWC47810.1 hypothetical protein CG478_004820 [Bacillus cytotoxicus]AWC52805.1 hypothetical protein CG477_010390 [Bacillus cytotoxicus]
MADTQNNGNKKFFKKRFYNVLTSIPLVVIALITIYSLDFGFTHFLLLTGITTIILMIQCIYYYLAWKNYTSNS